MKEIYFKVLDSENEQDVRSFIALADDAEVKEFVNYLCITKEDFVQSFFDNVNFSMTERLLGIFDSHTNTMVGAIHLLPGSFDYAVSNLEGSYFIGKPYRHQGYATAMIQKLQEKFQVSEYRLLVFYVALTNTPNLTLLRKLDFTERRLDDNVHVFVKNL